MKKIAITLLSINLIVAAWLLISNVLHEDDGLPPIEASVARLELLQESLPDAVHSGEAGVQAITHPTEAEAPQRDVAAVVEPDRMLVCFSVGPYAEEALANKAIVSLQQNGMATELRTEWHHEFFGYWVYLPPFPSREAALAVTRELKLHGIDDFFIVLASVKQNAISLGVYRNHETALALQKRLQSMDFKARLEKRMRNRPEFWLDYTGNLRLSENLLSALRNDVPDIKQLARACP